ncbi:MAG: SUMF1/EgtB/PvdO family nonheme iron enzyme [Opitutaceae bacterium]
MKTSFLKLILLSLSVSFSLTGQLIGQSQIHKLLAADGATSDLFGVSVSISGNTAIVGAVLDADNGFESGSAYVFDVATGQQLAKLVPDDGAFGDRFGQSVSIFGSTAVVGAYYDDDNGSNSGSVYVFDVTTGQQLTKLTANDGVSGDHFGYSVAISGSTAIVGARLDDDSGSNSGSVYVFDVTTGQQLAKLVPNDGATGDWFGVAVSISGNTAVIGAVNDDDNGSSSGSAYVFDVGTGQQLAKLTANDGAVSDWFGGSVTIDGNIAVIGASGDDDNGSSSGSAYVFDVTTGQQLSKLTPNDGTSNDFFGESVAVSDRIVVIGAYSDYDSGFESGSGYVFGVTTGQQLFKLTPNDGSDGDRFGVSIAVSGSNAVIGADYDDDNGSESGSAYIFKVVNDPPTDVALDNNSIFESAPSGSIVGQFVVTDPDDASGFTFSLVSGSGDTDNASFSVSGDSLLSATTFNYEAQRDYSIRVQVEDPAGNTFEEALTVNILNVNIPSTTFEDFDGFTTGVAAWGGQNNWTLHSGGGTTGHGILEPFTDPTDHTAYIGFNPPTPDTGFLAIYSPALSYEADNATVRIDASLSDSTNGVDDEYYVAIYNSDGSAIGRLRFFNADNSVYWSDFNQSTYLVTLPLDTFYTFELQLDFANNLVNILIDGASYAENLTLNGTGLFRDLNSLGFVWLYTPNNAGDGFLMFDDLEIIAPVQLDHLSSEVEAEIFGEGINQFSMEFVRVHNAGNGDNGAGGGIYSEPYGGVGYNFRMSRREVSQDMIDRASISGMVGVSAGPWGGDQPAADVDWFEAAAFVNWLNTSEGHQAAYDLTWNGSSWSMNLWPVEVQAPTGVDSGTNGYRHVDARYFLPSEDEWYKAAYHKNDGDTSNYWDHAHASHTQPDGIDSSGDTIFDIVVDDGFKLSEPKTIDDVGLPSAYGTLGQGGNIYEWTETAYDGNNNSSSENRAIRGGDWDSSSFIASAGDRPGTGFFNATNFIGFRVARVADVNFDGDAASDDWELANGFDPDVSGDLETLDTDGDGTVDLVEIFQGSDRNAVSSPFQLSENAFVANQFCTTYLRSTTQNSVSEKSQWSSNLVDWYDSGDSAEGITVDFSESAVPGVSDQEIVSAKAEVTSGSTSQLFYRLVFEPVE